MGQSMARLGAEVIKYEPQGPEGRSFCQASGTDKIRALIQSKMPDDSFARSRQPSKFPYFTPNCQKRNEYISVFSSTNFEMGLPAPWPALGSMRSRMGRSGPLAASFCSRAAIFLACMGSTRVSLSAVMKSTDG